MQSRALTVGDRPFCVPEDDSPPTSEMANTDACFEFDLSNCFRPHLGFPMIPHSLKKKLLDPLLWISYRAVPFFA